MNKQPKKIYIKWVENWVKIHWPQMQRISLEELEENNIQNPETVVSWTTASGAHITFYKNYKCDGLIFEPRPYDSEEGGLQILSMPDTEREFREMMDNYLKDEGLCIDDVGRVFQAKDMKWARALVNPKEEVLSPGKEPKKYTNVLYVVSSGDGVLYQINNHLIAQKKLGRNETLKCGYFSWQKFTNGTYSKDLFYPIKHGFSGYFTDNNYHIWDFSVGSTPLLAMLDILIDFDKPDEKVRLYNILKNLKGKNAIQVKKYRKKRSVNQNAYLFGVVYRYVGQEIGLTTEEAHQTMKEHFLSYEKRLPNGTVAKFTKSTTDLDTLEMTNYIEEIRSFMLEQFSCLIPEPEQSIY